MKKTLSILLALVMLLAMAMPAMAEATNPGSITIKGVENVSVADKTFNAYKILDLKMVGDKGYVYTVPAELVDFYSAEFELDKDLGDFDYEVTQKITAMKDDSDALFAFAAKALAAAKAANITPATAAGAEGAESVVIGNLPLGYYVVEDATTYVSGEEKIAISALMLDTTNPAVEITLKADKPVIIKKIDGDKDTDATTEDLVDTDNVAIGDKVPYDVRTNVPDMIGYKKYFFVVNDTMCKGLTYNNDMVITLGGETLKACTATEEGHVHTEDCDYITTVTTTEAGETAIEIVFINFIQYKDTTDAEIVLTYSATLNEHAVLGIDGNPNKVDLTYSNNPNMDAEGTPGNADKPSEKSPVGKTPEDITITYATGIELIKVDEAGNHLEGAEFSLTGEKLNTVLVTKEVFTEDENGTYWKLANGTYTTEDPATEGMDQTKYESTTTKYKMDVVNEKVVKGTEAVNAKGIVGTDGVLQFDGLAEGVYTITEITAPAGYNLLTAPITVTITFTDPEGEVATGTEQGAWFYSASGAVNLDETAANGGRVSLTVVNTTGTVLPETGGIGTTVFYVVGGLLMVAAFVVLIARRRVNAEK